MNCPHYKPTIQFILFSIVYFKSILPAVAPWNDKIYIQSLDNNRYKLQKVKRLLLLVDHKFHYINILYIK